MSGGRPATVDVNHDRVQVSAAFPRGPHLRPDGRRPRQSLARWTLTRPPKSVTVTLAGSLSATHTQTRAASTRRRIGPARTSGRSATKFPPALRGEVRLASEGRGNLVADLPLVLAGPILRRVDAGRVCVWVALSEPGNVTVTALQRAGRLHRARHGGGRRPSARRCGRRANAAQSCTWSSWTSRSRACRRFPATATTSSSAGPARPPGARSAQGRQRDAGPLLARLRARPVAELRHAGPDDRATSCSSRARAGGRTPPAPTRWPTSTTSSPNTASDLTRRPQQLFLTGDQIYADDLSGCLLPQINAIGRELLGFTETLPIDNRAVRGHDRGVPRAAPPQGGPGDRSLLDQRRPAPPALLRRAAGDAPAGVEPLAVAPADHRRRGVRPVPERRGNHLSDWEAYYGRSPAIRARTV